MRVHAAFAVIALVPAVVLAGCNQTHLGTSATPTPTGTGTPTPTPTPTIPPGPVYQTARGVVHVHSPFSHDACDGNGLPGGVPNAACLADLRAAACETGLDFVSITDHPSFMKDNPFLADLLHDASQGDELVMEGSEPIANRLVCPGGHRVLLTVGYESTHTLPLGLKHHLPGPPDAYAGLTDGVPLAEANELVATLKAGGAVVAIAHSEEDDLSASRIVETGIDAMEWYNPHGNFKSLASGDGLSSDPLAALDTIRDMEKFLLGSSSGADADLVYLLLLPAWPQEGFDKWREVQKSRAVTGLLGSDVHQNISVDPICAGSPAIEALCAVAAALYPNALTLLLSGGQITLADGQRIDGYSRIFRWLDNRVLVADDSPAALADALRAGRSYGVFGVFGDPAGFAFTGTDPAGTPWPLGSDLAAPVALHVQEPRPALMGGAPFTPEDAALAQVTIRLFRTDASGTTLAAEAVNAPLDFAAGPGTWHVEVWIRPQHLVPALGTETQLADRDYLWVITNPIRVN